jgi:hypothetical protein
MMPALIKDITGRNFGYLSVIRYVKTHNNRAFWECQCICGRVTSVRSNNLVSGTTKSCGCLFKDRVTTHGKSKSPIYQVWRDMLKRCYKDDSKVYEGYGSRGIIVCDSWHKFEDFYKDMGDPPFVAASLDRIDNNGDYTKENCRWATTKQQSDNRNNTLWLTYKGETKTSSQWALQLGIPSYTIRNRIRCGWDADRIFTTPVKVRK